MMPDAWESFSPHFALFGDLYAKMRALWRVSRQMSKIPEMFLSVIFGIIVVVMFVIIVKS